MKNRITKEEIVQYFADLHAKYFRPDEECADCKNCPFMAECNRFDCGPDLPCEIFGHIMGQSEESLETFRNTLLDEKLNKQ